MECLLAERSVDTSFATTYCFIPINTKHSTVPLLRPFISPIRAQGQKPKSRYPRSLNPLCSYSTTSPQIRGRPPCLPTPSATQLLSPHSLFLPSLLPRAPRTSMGPAGLTAYAATTKPSHWFKISATYQGAPWCYAASCATLEGRKVKRQVFAADLTRRRVSVSPGGVDETVGKGEKKGKG